MKGFKEFILKGNIIDMAVGVIIGGAFGKIVTSLVNDILMPLISTLLGVIDFTMLQVKIGQSTINYGMFIQNVVDFLIIGFTLYVMLKVAIKASEALHLKKEEEPAAPEGPSEVELLTEIRDMLKARS